MELASFVAGAGLGALGTGLINAAAAFLKDRRDAATAHEDRRRTAYAAWAAEMSSATAAIVHRQFPDDDRGGGKDACMATIARLSTAEVATLLLEEDAVYREWIGVYTERMKTLVAESIFFHALPEAARNRHRARVYNLDVRTRDLVAMLAQDRARARLWSLGKQARVPLFPGESPTEIRKAWEADEKAFAETVAKSTAQP